MNLYTKVKGAIKAFTHLWTVKVLWEGKLYVHKARNAADAYTWGDCYPLDATVLILDFQVPYATHVRGVWGRP